MFLDFSRDFTDEEINYINGLSESELEKIEQDCKDFIMLCDTNQINRKLLINSLYGALGNIYFRLYDLRNASAITLFGQLAIQWIERKVNEYLNRVCGLENHAFVVAGDTDSIYICVDKLIDKVGIERFKETNDLIEFLNQFGLKKLEPAIDVAFRELCEYMNNREHLMFMDREAISAPPLGSNGIGGFWKAKKRYALNVYDLEGTRFKKPYLKIMGMETQQSSTPKAVQDALEESIRIMLQEGEKPLQTFYKQFENDYRKLDYKVIAKVSTANNLAKYDDDGYPAPKCPSHVRGVLTYHRAIKDIPGATMIQEGDKVMVLPLKDGNPFGDKVIAWPSGSEIQSDIRDIVLKHIDYPMLFGKSFKTPLEGMTEAAGLQYEKKATLEDIFGF